MRFQIQQPGMSEKTTVRYETPTNFHLHLLPGPTRETRELAFQQLRPAEQQQEIIRSAGSQENQKGSEEDKSPTTAVVR